jgi:tetratricopeptide (TPR) repeat protein
MHLRSWSTAMVVLAMIGVMLFMGCAATVEVKEPTAAELAARQDSIAAANEFELKKARMFAYDKLKTQQWNDAQKYLWQVVELDVKDQYNDWDRLYQTYMSLNNPDSAQVVLRMGLERHPADPFLNATYGFILKAQGQYQEALDFYDTALAGDITDNDKIEYLRKKAEIHETLGDPEAAIASYEALIVLSPNDMGAKNSLTALVSMHRSPEEYIARLVEEIAANPNDMQKRMDLLHAYQDQSQNDKVIEQADQILAIDASKIDVYRAKAKAFDNLNQLDNSIATYEGLLAVDASNWDSMLRIADNQRLLSRYTSARSWVNRAKNAGGSQGEADYILGLTYESAGDDCSAGGLEYDDKLVYTIALGLFEKAASSSDYNVKGKAASRVDYMKQFAPAKADWFLNQTKEMPAKDCYGWINASWSETKYIASFLSQYGQ